MIDTEHNLSSGSVTVSYAIQKKDLIGFYVWQHMQQPSSVKVQNRLKYWFPLIFGIGGVFIAITANATLGVLGIAWALGLMLLGFNQPAAIRKRSEVMIDANYLDLLQEVHTVTLSNMRLVSDSEHVRLELNPDKLSEIVEVDDHFYVRSTAGMFIIIAKRGTDDLDGLRNRLRSYKCPFRSMSYKSLA